MRFSLRSPAFRCCRWTALPTRYLLTDRTGIRNFQPDYVDMQTSSDRRQFMGHLSFLFRNRARSGRFRSIHRLESIKRCTLFEKLDVNGEKNQVFSLFSRISCRVLISKINLLFRCHFFMENQNNCLNLYNIIENLIYFSYTSRGWIIFDGFEWKYFLERSYRKCEKFWCPLPWCIGFNFFFYLLNVLNIDIIFTYWKAKINMRH